MDKTLELLKELTEAHGVPGYEAPIRSIIRQHLMGLGELTQDKLGSVICEKKGIQDAPRVMLAAHMDEIGFMVKHVTKEGFLKFLQLGGWWDQVLLGQRVYIKTAKGDVLGTIGATPIHLLPADERSKLVVKKDMYIDIGATSEDEVAEIGVRPGDPIVPLADFQVLASGKTLMGKAFDDRIGVAMLIEALQAMQTEKHPNTLFGVATVMEEATLSGAYTSVRAVDPDVAIVLEADISGDVPGISPEQSDLKLGKGPSMFMYDARMIPNLKLRDLVRSVAAELDIPLQLSFMEGGATDGWAIHMHKTGVPTVVLAAPVRHIHSHNGILHRTDYDNAVKLLTVLLKRLDAETVTALTA